MTVGVEEFMKNFHVCISENVLVYTKNEKHVDCATGETVVRENSKISRKCELCHIKKTTVAVGLSIKKRGLNAVQL